MSRTDVHTPFRVKVLDPEWRPFFRESHRHETGPCDLHQFDPMDWPATRCHIDWVASNRNIHCGCRLCTGQAGRRLGRRRDRTRLRAELRDLVKSDRAGRDDADVVTPRRNTAWLPSGFRGTTSTTDTTNTVPV